MKRRRWMHPLYCPACRLRRRPGKVGHGLCDCNVPMEGATERNGILMADVTWNEMHANRDALEAYVASAPSAPRFPAWLTDSAEAADEEANG